MTYEEAIQQSEKYAKEAAYYAGATRTYPDSALRAATFQRLAEYWFERAKDIRAHGTKRDTTGGY